MWLPPQLKQIAGHSSPSCAPTPQLSHPNSSAILASRLCHTRFEESFENGKQKRGKCGGLCCCGRGTRGSCDVLQISSRITLHLDDSLFGTDERGAVFLLPCFSLPIARELQLLSSVSSSADRVVCLACLGTCVYASFGRLVQCFSTLLREEFGSREGKSSEVEGQCCAVMGTISRRWFILRNLCKTPGIRFSDTTTICYTPSTHYFLFFFLFFFLLPELAAAACCCCCAAALAAWLSRRAFRDCNFGISSPIFSSNCFSADPSGNHHV